MSARVANSVSESELLQRLRWEVERLEGTGYLLPMAARIEQAETLSDFRKAIAALTLGTWRESVTGHYGPTAKRS